MGADDPLARYAESCKAAVADYIERSTRFNVKDVRIADARATARTFRVSVTHALDVHGEVADYHGDHAPGSGDFATSDWQWYQQQVQAQLDAELARTATLDSLIATVSGQHYPALTARTRLRTHPRRLFHPYTCKGCHGKGRVACGDCGGDGEKTCWGCVGRGKVNCSTCHGGGTVTVTRQVSDYNGYTRTEHQQHPCSHCAGGTVRCHGCGGSGRVTCGTCRGSGTVTCQGCSGHGCLTRVTTTHTYSTPRFAGHFPQGTPDYVAQTLDKIGYGALAQHGRAVLAGATRLEGQPAARFMYDCTLAFCELSVDVRGCRSEWVLFGATPQVFDAGGALEALLHGDFDALAALAKSGRRWWPWFHRSARQVVAPFMESELNQAIVDASTAGKALPAIVETANRAVSLAYVQQALQHLEQTVRAASRWSRIKWGVGLCLLAVPLVIPVLQYWERDVERSFTGAAPYFIRHGGAGSFDWTMGWLTLCVTVPGWLAARWISRRWLRRAGGARTVAWAARHGLLMGTKTGMLVIASAVALAGAAHGRWPLWIDATGKVYGVVPLYAPPRVLAPPPAAPPVKPKPKPRRKKVKREAAPASAPVVPDSVPADGLF